ncbi:hypothetical protein ADS69_00003 [Enterobacter phage phiEap-3]|uniref:SprT-like domain-containing protein n=1 Tax=Enterobacter phage phiEap-3 TaxID=1682394 RepID=A0A0K2FH63_9CAUD|nr:hypothetical protein FDI05_gp003 [Enterobacter phage phiEap-3]ALA45108.1 hypothetical protein ADS69_00003 [Enterobacter phage phiEap-3]
MLKTRSAMEVTHWARTMMEKHGLISNGWTFRINGRITKTLGRCSYAKKLIELSGRHVAEDIYEDILDTLLHEIAHALVGRGYEHGKVWQAMALRLGAKPSPSKTTTKDANLVDKNEILYCLFMKDYQGREVYQAKADKKFYNDVMNGVKDMKNIWISGRKAYTKGRLYIRPVTNEELAYIRKEG